MKHRRPSDIEIEARVAGLKDFETPSLEAIERRRGQLWLLAAFLMLALAGGMVLLSVRRPAEVITHFIPLYMVRVLFVGLTALMTIYLFDKESSLKKLTRHLIDERVLTAALSNRLKEVSVLSKAGQAVSRVLDLDETCRIILEAAVDLLNAEEGSVMLLDAKDEHLVVAAARSVNDRVHDAVVKVGQGIAGWVAVHREPVLVDGTPPPGMFDALESKERPIASAASVPLLSGGELQGVLNVSDISGVRRFSEYDLRALQLFAEHAAIAIRNAQAFEQERAAVQRLEEVDRMKSEFIATISHELRTPLTSIIGASKTMRLRGKILTEEQRADFLQVIERQGERLLRLIEEVLSASRIETGGATLKREPVELVSIAREVVKAEESAGVDNPIVLEAPERVDAFGDPTAVEQILTNLIDNAAKYSEPGSPISVRLADEPAEVLIRVNDTGQGIPTKALPTIFDRFRQVDQSTTRRTGGVGLGLYIVKNLVSGMGATITVESEEGRGSTFTVKLPKRKERDG